MNEVWYDDACVVLVVARVENGCKTEREKEGRERERWGFCSCQKIFSTDMADYTVIL